MEHKGNDHNWKTGSYDELHSRREMLEHYKKWPPLHHSVRTQVCVILTGNAMQISKPIGAKVAYDFPSSLS